MLSRRDYINTLGLKFRLIFDISELKQAHKLTTLNSKRKPQNSRKKENKLINKVILIVLNQNNKMARLFYLTAAMCLALVASVSAADEQSTPSQGGRAPNELNLVTPNTPNNQESRQLDNQALPGQLETSTPSVPVSPSGTTDLAPLNQNEQVDQDDQDDLNDYQQPQPFQPFQPFGGFRQPPNFNSRPNPLFGLFGGNLFDSIRRHSDMMNQRFQELENQAAEGKSISYFSRNGVSYVRTCTVERVQN